MRQIRMEAEGRDAHQPSSGIEIPHGRERGYLSGAGHHSGATGFDLIGAGTISGKIAKDLFEIVWTEGGDPHALVESHGLKQVTDSGAIERLISEIVAANPDRAAQVQAKPALLGWFVGQVMKASGGKANPQAVNALLRTKLGM